MPRSTFTRNQLVYGGLALAVLLMGLASRRFFGDYPFVRLYVGDVLWALMVFLGIGFLFRHWSTRAVAAAALSFSVCIEISQLYQAPWITNLRATPLGGLILGYTFVWSDLLCYTAGIGVGVLLDRYHWRVRQESRVPIP